MKFKYWITAARLRTLPLALSCILIGGSLSINYKGSLPINTFILCLVTTLMLQILSNFANDYGDGIKGSDDKRLQKDRMVSQGHISVRSMLIAIIITSIITFITGLFLLINVFESLNSLLFIFFLLLGIGSIVAAIKYTVGRSAFGYKGLGDLFVFIFFGLVGVIGSFYLFTKNFHWITIPGAIFTGALSSAVLNTNNMRDYTTDKLNGKNTLVVIIGIKNAKIYHYSLITIAFVSMLFILNRDNIISWICLIPFIFLFKNIINVYRSINLIVLDKELKTIALSCFACTFLYFIITLLQNNYLIP